VKQALCRPRVRVISDNDYSGDPDGLVQLAHHFLSPSAEMRLVIGGQVASYDPAASPTSAEASRDEAWRIAQLTGRTDVPVLTGSNDPLRTPEAPHETDAVNAIIAEAMRDDTELPLFMACGGSLTNIACAWLVEPRISSRLTLVWIGGAEHEGLAEPPPNGLPVEYNTSIDLLAAQVVFNRSDLQIWQVPQDAYRQVLTSRAELDQRMAGCGALGAHLVDAINRFAQQVERLGVGTGETYILGDSPLVLLTALLAPFFPAPSSTAWMTKERPTILDSGGYGPPSTHSQVRVFTRMDSRLILEDLYAKLALHAAQSEPLTPPLALRRTSLAHLGNALDQRP
jgi:hypothetical protein